MEYRIGKDGFSNSRKAMTIVLEKEEQIGETINTLLNEHYQEDISTIYVYKSGRSYVYYVKYYFYQRKDTKKWKSAKSGKAYDMGNPTQKDEFQKILIRLAMGITDYSDMTEDEIERFAKKQHLEQEQQNLQAEILDIQDKIREYENKLKLCQKQYERNQAELAEL